MLGLIFGRNAGLTMLEPALILPRLLPCLLDLESRGLIEAGVDALLGETMADIDGLDVAEPGLAKVELAVLKGPSLGVLRAAIRGVASAEVLGVI